MPQVKLELFCGQLEPGAKKKEKELYELRIQQHAQAKELADKAGFDSAFEEHTEKGVQHLDGYLYIPPRFAVQMVRILKKYGVEVHIADVPTEELAQEIEALDWVVEVNVE